MADVNGGVVVDRVEGVSGELPALGADRRLYSKVGLWLDWFSMTLRQVIDAREPAISVMIPSIPAYDHSTTVACLHDQSLTSPYEILVVNDGSLDRSEARNEGLRKARAAVVAFTDDDTEPPPEWLATIVREFRNDPQLVCLEGVVFGGCRNVDPRHYVGCNLAVRRDEALAVGGFRSDFSEWREDLEFGWRMEKEADGTCRFSVDVRMCHPTVPRTTFKPALERKLRNEYPQRYDVVLNATLKSRLRRSLRALGILEPFQRGVNSVRRLIGTL
jgi:glycosyltransferase involved in cell wall biosynthesis